MNISKWIQKAADGMVLIATAALSLTIILNFIEITRRYLLGKSFFWIQDVTLLCMMWFIFPGIVKISHADSDIVVDYFIGKVSPKYRDWIKAATECLVASFCGILCFYSVKLTILRLGKAMSTSEIPLFYYTLAMNICCLLLTVIYLEKVARRFRGKLDRKEAK